jgi:very-short-patch-repair endonuclease
VVSAAVSDSADPAQRVRSAARGTRDHRGVVAFGEPGVRSERPPPLDLAIARLAAGRHGVLTLGELRALGLSARAVQKRAAAGRLHRKYPEVYAVGHPTLTPDGRRYAAVCACGSGAVASHRMAAALWGLRAYGHLEVTVPGRRAGPPDVIVHRTRALDPRDRTTIRVIPVTTLVRTIVDLAEVESIDRMERLIDKAARLDAFDLGALEATAARLTGRRGAPVLRTALGLPSPGLTRSQLEDAFLALCRAHGLPRPRTNTHVEAGDRLYEADALFARERLIVELDGGGHDTPAAFQDDRRRDAALAAAGYQTVRYTDRRVSREAATVAAEVRAILRSRATLNP